MAEGGFEPFNNQYGQCSFSLVVTSDKLVDNCTRLALVSNSGSIFCQGVLVRLEIELFDCASLHIRTRKSTSLVSNL